MSKKEDILKAALGLFVENGEQATSMKWVAKEAKCGIGTMYNYFPSKNDLISELYLELKKAFFSSILKVLDESKPVKQQFIDTWLKAIEFAIYNHKEYKYLEIFAHSPKISPQVMEEVNKLVYPFIKIYEKGKKEGIIKDIDSILLIMFVTGAISASLIRNSNISDNEKKVIILMAWDAIKN